MIAPFSLTAPNPSAVARRLAIAAENGDCAELNSLLDIGGYDPQAPLNAAHAAAGQGHAECLKLLLTRHPECVDFTTNAGWTLAHVAAHAGRADCLALLSELGPIDLRDNAGWSPLHLAIRANHPDCSAFLLPRTADWEKPTQEGLSLVHLAAQAGNASMLARLLDRGLSVEPCSADGFLPIHFAAESGHAACLAALLKQGARHDAFCAKGFAPLQMAAAKGHLACIQLLLDPPLKSSQKALTEAARAAVHHEDSKPFRLLLDYGADPHHTDSEWRSFSYLAAAAGALDTLKLLRERGANLSERDKRGLSPLHVAAQNGRTDCLDFLLKQGANPEEPTDDGSTPMHMAADQGRGDCMKRLIAAGAALFPRNRNKETPACLLLRTSGDTPLDCVWVHSRGAPPHHTMALHHIVLSASSAELLHWAGHNRAILGLLTRWAKLDEADWDALMKRPDFHGPMRAKSKRSPGSFCLEDLLKNPNAPGVALRFFTQTPIRTLIEWAGSNPRRLASLAAHAPLDAEHGWKLICHQEFPSRRPHFEIGAAYGEPDFDEVALSKNKQAHPCIREFLTHTSSEALLSWATSTNCDERLKLLVARAKLDERTWRELFFHPKFHADAFPESDFDWEAVRRNPHAYEVMNDFLVDTPSETLLRWAGNQVRRLAILAAEARLEPAYWLRLVGHKAFDTSPSRRSANQWGGRRCRFDINTLLSNPHIDPTTRKDLELGLA